MAINGSCAAVLCVAATVLAACGDTTSLPPVADPGLWQTTTTTDIKSDTDATQRVSTTKLCIDAGMAAKMRLGSRSSPGCSRKFFRYREGRFEQESECSFDGTPMTSKGTGSGDFKRYYETDSHVAGKNHAPGMTEVHTHVVAKWVGPCPDDMTPGDMLMENGIKLNMKDKI